MNHLPVAHLLVIRLFAFHFPGVHSSPLAGAGGDSCPGPCDALWRALSAAIKMGQSRPAAAIFRRFLLRMAHRDSTTGRGCRVENPAETGGCRSLECMLSSMRVATGCPILVRVFSRPGHCLPYSSRSPSTPHCGPNGAKIDLSSQVFANFQYLSIVYYNHEEYVASRNHRENRGSPLRRLKSFTQHRAARILKVF